MDSRGWKVYRASRSSTTMPLDVGDDESVRRCVKLILAQEGRIDAVVNNAGFALGGAIEDTPIGMAQELFEVNFFGAMRICRAVLPAMREQRGGHIVNIGSIAGLVAVPYQGLYSASKFALEGFSESLRLEVKQFGIRVVLVEPGDHRTDLTTNRKLTGASECYRLACDAAVDRMALDEQAGPDPSGIARLVCRILEDPNPRLRYTAGPFVQRAAVWLKRLGPYAFTEAALSAYYSR
jgi:NAD(P)-dependent dehydrogenase (short-subunit alcohol dehydrogenase family)